MLPSKVLSKEIHAPTFHALHPVESVVKTNIFKPRILTPAANWPLEAMLDNVLEAGVDQALLTLVNSVH